METMQEIIKKMREKKSIGQMSQTTYNEPILVNNIEEKNELSDFGIPKRHWNVTWEWLRSNNRSKDVDAFKQAREYSDNIDANIKKGTGLILKGGVGVGKTSVAVAIMRDCIDKRYRPYFISSLNMLDKIYSLKNSKDELRALEDKLTGTKLLVLDDLGAESSVEWVNIKVMSILAKRYDDMLPIIATTNLANDDIKGKYERTPHLYHLVSVV